MTTLESALSLWSRGLSVIPVPRPDGLHDGKVPTLAWKEFQTRRPTEAEILSWFAAPSNLAVVTGALSGVVVVDADTPAAVAWVTKHLPYTAWQVQTARGFHLYYRHPRVRVTNRARIETRDGRLALDVRGDGGYVIGPGSLHASGHEYREAGDWSVSRDALPHFWPGWLQRSERVTAPASQRPRPSGELVDRARRYLARVPRPDIGHGSDTATLYAACRVVRGFGVSETDAIGLLEEWAGGRPGWTREWLAAKVRNAMAYGTEPIGALR